MKKFLIFIGVLLLFAIGFVFYDYFNNDNDEIEKEKLIKGIVILLILFILVAIFEVSYLGSIQSGILNMINKG